MEPRMILIIDDDDDARLLLSLRLKAASYATAVAADAREAITMARRVQPAAILLDLGLPDGNGFLVLDRLKRIPALAHIPIIIVSAEEPQEVEGIALARGALAFLHKPVEQTALLAAVQRACEPCGDVASLTQLGPALSV